MPVLCPNCPVCGQPPEMAMSLAQAFCTNADCDAFSWNMTITASANKEMLNVIDVSGLHNYPPDEQR